VGPSGGREGNLRRQRVEDLGRRNEEIGCSVARMKIVNHHGIGRRWRHLVVIVILGRENMEILVRMRIERG